MPDLAFGDEIADGARDILDRHLGIDPVLIEKIDRLDTQPLERAVDRRADAFGPAAEATILPGRGIDVEAELGGDHDLLTHRAQRLADQFLIDERTIDFRRVEKGHATIDRGAEQRHALVLRKRVRIAEADPHAAEADGRDMKAAAAEFACLHDVSPQFVAGSASAKMVRAIATAVPAVGQPA